MSKEKAVLFKQFLIDAIVNGNKFDAGDGQGEILHFKTQTRRNHKLGNVGDILTFTDKAVFEQFYSENWGDDEFESWNDDTKEYDLIFINEIWKAWLKKEPKLILTGVRLECLSDISNEDCIKEGVFADKTKYTYFTWGYNKEKPDDFFQTPYAAFKRLIAFIKNIEINDLDLNSMVWVHDFEMI